MDVSSRIRRFAPIQRLPQALQDKAVRLATITRFDTHGTIYRQGDGEESVHYLLDGSVELVWQDRVTRTLNATNKAALRPLDPPGRKRYTVRAGEHATIASFNRVALDRLIEQFESHHENGELEVSEIATERSSDWMIKMLQSGLFSMLPAQNIQKIFARMERVEYRADEVVVRQGSAGEYYYVIEKGYCEVSRTIPSGRGQIHLADLAAGTAFGEEALISDQPRNATITMLSDGMLMRLAKRDFVDLLLNEVLHPLDVDAAIAVVEDGGAWLDIRYPEDHARAAIRGSENIPTNMLRLHSSRLRKDFRYVIIGEDADQSAIAAFLLSERGFNVAYLDAGIEHVLEQHPELLAEKQESHNDNNGDTPTVVFLPGSEVAGADFNPDTDDPDDDSPLENTITRIAGLYTHAEAQREMNNTTPVDKYSETATGHALADIIDELSEQHDSVGEPEADVADDPRTAASAAAASSSTPGHAIEDGITRILREMESQLRGEVERAVTTRGAALEADYREKLTRMRALTEQEVAQREQAIERRFADDYKEKEQLLRSYYKKLIALANTISRQKAQLQEARKQFESKLQSANQLYREVEEMRQLLTDHIGYLESDAIDEIPRLSMNL